MSFMLLKLLFMLCLCIVDCASATVLIKESYYYYYYYYTSASACRLSKAWMS